jgi:protein SCO1/2
VLHDGRITSLAALLARRASAVQLMFTSCTSTCPIQGAIFRRVQELIPDQAQRDIQLVSLTVDPKHDTPAALVKWLQGFSARPGWIAAAPKPGDVARLRKLAGGGGSPADNHSTRVQIANRDGVLIWRTNELPEAEDIASILHEI